MAFGLTIGTERATALQNAIQDELTKRGYNPEPDNVMAEYITIMIINNKTSAQISSELEDLIGTEFDSSFVDWLFAEAQKTAPGSEATPAPAAAPEPIPSTSTPVRDTPPHIQQDTSRRPSGAARPSAPLYHQAISQAIPSNSPPDRKRTRSKSPGHANKTRRVDLPTGPRAMLKEGNTSGGTSSSRSLIDRVGPARNGHGHGPHVRDNANRIDNIQARIDSITNGSPDMSMMMGGGGFPLNGMPPMDMNAMPGMGNPIMLQEMMMNQMLLMQQMAGAISMLAPGAPFMNGGMPMQPGMGGDSPMFQQQGGPPIESSRGRGRGRGGFPGRGRGRGGHTGNAPSHTEENASSNPPEATVASALAFPASNSAPAATALVPAAVTLAPATPTPAPSMVAPSPITPTSSAPTRTGFVPPERPQSPSLCKFGLKCTNAFCRWSHPSPVATPESGVVLSNDPCESGKNCKDKDCIKSHVSPAVLNPAAAVEHKPAHFAPPVTHAVSSQTACRFGNACTRPNCPFVHPTRAPVAPCRFGASCTRANCTFQHPEGRVLPSSFHRGLSTTGGLVNVHTPEPGTMGASSHHRSVTFNKPPGAGSSNTDLEKRIKEMEEKKTQAQAAVVQAQAAAGKKEDGNNKSVPVSV